jgi:exonuclease III
MRIVSWNVNARRGAMQSQVAALEALSPDVIALQEVTPATVLPFQTALHRAGWAHIVDSFSLAPGDFNPIGPRRYGLLLASRYPLVPESPERFRVPWPERVLSAVLEAPGGRVDIHNTHVPPGSSNGWVKIDHLNELFHGLAHPHPHPRILCGDFNTPQAELETGEVVTWGQRRGRDGRWRVRRTFRGGSGADWDAAERRVLEGLAEWGIPDVFRLVNGFEAEDFSWYLHRKGRTVKRRFDHIFASARLRPISCEYVHEFRTRGLSDHSPILAEFGGGMESAA